MSFQASVGRSGDSRVDGLIHGWIWGGGTVSYSDPDRAADYGAGYVSDYDGDGRSAQADGFARLSALQLGAVRSVLDAGAVPAAKAGFTVEGLTGLAVSYAGAGSGLGDIRVAATADAPTAYAYMPGPGIGGDVWLGAASASPRVGSYGYLSFLHEIGHALGLKHPHEAEGFGAVPLAWDGLEFTVMTYRAWIGAAPTGYRFEAAGAPQTFMMLDIAALQHMYGADFTTNAGDTVYRWTPGSGQTLVNGQVGIDGGGNRIFATIWDGGGRDTYDLSAYASGVRVDLRPGCHSVFSEAQLAGLGGGPNDGHARGNVFNALQYHGDARSLIENATGGAGNDRLIGNAAANCLVGGPGNDRLQGLGGGDVLAGGRGADTFVFAAARDSRGAGCDRIVAAGGAPAFEHPGAGRGDLIDLRGIDADLLRPGDQAFVFGSSHARGHLWLSDVGGATYVRGNVDGDAAPEFQLMIIDGAVRASAYSAHDFLL